MKTINIDGVIGWDVDNRDVKEQLPKNGTEDIEVHIASPGGLISEGFNIYNTLKNYAGKVTTVLTGMVASMGTYIAMVGEERTAERNATFMIHNGSMGAWGDHRLMLKAHNHLNSLTNMIAKEYAVKADTPLDEIRSAMDETTYYYGDEIKEAGFVHEMIGDDVDPDPGARAEAIATAELMFQECETKMNDPEVVKKEVKALATMMESEPVKKKVKKTVNSDNIKQEVNKMTLEELKKDHPELYAKIIAMGVETGTEAGINQERERVKVLTEMRAKFPKAHSQKVIDEAVSEGHDLSQLTLNLMSADQVAEELEKAKKDKKKTPANTEDETPEMKDGKMVHTDHIDAKSDELAKTLGLKK